MVPHVNNVIADNELEVEILGKRYVETSAAAALRGIEFMWKHDLVDITPGEAAGISYLPRMATDRKGAPKLGSARPAGWRAGPPPIGPGGPRARAGRPRARA